jgi:hypothetical protein
MNPADQNSESHSNGADYSRIPDDMSTLKLGAFSEAFLEALGKLADYSMGMLECPKVNDSLSDEEQKERAITFATGFCESQFAELNDGSIQFQNLVVECLLNSKPKGDVLDS